ncbi:MAG: membrane-binding protein [Flavobacterium sp.]|nr:membrane-binding protein [Flavobacterium sp.]
MKKLLFIALLVSSLTYAQNSAPELEIIGNQVKATYYFENGAVQQVGHFLDGKLEGKWISYDQNGNVLSIAEYKNGAKTGKWKVYSHTLPVKEIDYVSNQIVSITESTSTALASKN